MAGGNYNEMGRRYELLFKAECLKRGILVLVPECAHLPFDAVVHVNGKFLKIQIKGTSTEHHHGGKVWYAFNARPMKKGTTYAQLGVDFVVGYVEHQGTWYIVPAGLITGQMFKIARSPQGQALTFRERWDLLA